MKPQRSLATKHHLGDLDLRILELAELSGGMRLSIHSVSDAVGSGEMLCWNSLRKLRKQRLIEGTTNIGHLSPITARGIQVLAEIDHK